MQWRAAAQAGLEARAGIEPAHQGFADLFIYDVSRFLSRGVGFAKFILSTFCPPRGTEADWGSGWLGSARSVAHPNARRYQADF
jgi:hypothetical protein